LKGRTSAGIAVGGGGREPLKRGLGSLNKSPSSEETPLLRGPSVECARGQDSCQRKKSRLEKEKVAKKPDDVRREEGFTRLRPLASRLPVKQRETVVLSSRRGGGYLKEKSTTNKAGGPRSARRKHIGGSHKMTRTQGSCKYSVRSFEMARGVRREQEKG